MEGAARQQRVRPSHLWELRKGSQEASGLIGCTPGEAGTAGVWLHTEGREGEAPVKGILNRLHQRCLAGNRVGSGGTCWAQPKRQDRELGNGSSPSRYIGKGSSPPRHRLLMAQGHLGTRPAPSAEAKPPQCLLRPCAQGGRSAP